MTTNNAYLLTCSTSSCNSSSYLAVSASTNTNDTQTFDGNAQYWKIISPENKTGTIMDGDKVKLLNLWGNQSWLDVCGGSTSACGSGKVYNVVTAKQNSLDSKKNLSVWSFSKSKSAQITG